MEAAPNLEFIGRLGSGLDIIDLDFASDRNIEVFSAPEGNRNAVAEHAMGMLLCLANNICRADHEVRSFYWNREKNRGFELQGKTLGIIGFGNNGRAFAEKFENWQTSVLSYDKYKKHYCQDLRFVTECDLEKVQKEADIISLHIPLTEETNGWIDEKFLSDCKEGVILINTSRGKVVYTADLLALLKSGHVSGACLDVFENEKVDSFNVEERRLYEELYALENVILTPHIAGWTVESKRKISEVLLQKIGSVI